MRPRLTAGLPFRNDLLILSIALKWRLVKGSWKINWRSDPIVLPLAEVSYVISAEQSTTINNSDKKVRIALFTDNPFDNYFYYFSISDFT